MVKATSSRLKKELIKRGATKEQANAYASLVRKFERESEGRGELHHTLPRNSGWWKRFANCKWNHVRVKWHLHIALHAYLCHIFPDNISLLAGVRAATMRRQSESPKKREYKERIITWRKNGKSVYWIAKRIGVSGSAIKTWIRSWGSEVIYVRKVVAKLNKNRKTITRLYESGRSIYWLAKKFKVSFKGMATAFATWGCGRRSKIQQQTFKRDSFKQQIIRWYISGKTTPYIGAKVGLSSHRISVALTLWGVPLRSRSEVASLRWKQDFSTRKRLKRRVIANPPAPARLVTRSSATRKTMNRFC